ncbi:MAG: dihydrolipoyl dehydrogenase [Proteobacteria bacterium]|nr:dihydrolipoyl dehydrogenase [Pseudomonadota bacterium]
MAEIEVKVPDIGDFADVGVIELLVGVGDRVEAEQSLVTVESDKASMELPSSSAGVVKALRVQVGDRVSEGSVLLVLEAEAAGGVAEVGGKGPKAAAAPAAAVAAPVAAPAVASAPHGTYDCDVVVIGGGPGGYSAAFRAADLGLKVVLVERYSTLGGVCLNVGCIPSKALLHVAAVMDEARHMADWGVTFGEPTIDLDKLRGHKAKVVGKLTGGLAAMAKMRQVESVRGVATFTSANTLSIDATDGPGQQTTGERRTLAFRYAIVAAGSQAIKLPFLPDDPRIVDSTGALSLASVPKRLLIVGGGIIGLEMGTVHSTLGTRLEVVEMLDQLMPGADTDLVKVWQRMNAHRFDAIRMGTRTVSAKAGKKGITVGFEAADGGTSEATYDMVLQAVGRAPNGHRIGADAAGVNVTERGVVVVDGQMRTSAPHIFAIGDIVGQPMLAHKAVHEAHVAAEVIAGECKGDAALASRAFDARVIPSVAYTDPEIAWVGLTESQAKAQGVEVTRGLFPWAASGRAIANGRDEGFTKLLFDKQTHRIVGGGLVGTHAGDMIGEVALAIEMGAEAVDIGRTVHPHPTLGESIGMAAEVAHGSCTDLPPPRR